VYGGRYGGIKLEVQSKSKSEIQIKYYVCLSFKGLCDDNHVN
jgi:hypothetical protein